MFTSMSDIGFGNKTLVISKELRERMTDNSNNWKVRTDTIDEIFILISDKISLSQEQVLSQSEMLMEFLVSLLNDQNFKIVLTTLMIISKAILFYNFR
jgi:hypothetical protein